MTRQVRNYSDTHWRGELFNPVSNANSSGRSVGRSVRALAGLRRGQAKIYHPGYLKRGADVFIKAKANHHSL